ncbi:unnamed protein product [Durusdinium trenchii]|uniref:Peptidase S9 prolyl oligopeptidase catalytic domain-containing protein n=1 Tax=Durusdinium trenchii TaxID=1381693 RepID=A0ABP0HAU0_9DINO
MSSCCTAISNCDGFVCCLGCLSLVPGFLRRVVNGVAFFPPRPPGYHVTEDRQVFLVESDYGLSPLPDLAQEGIVVDTVRMWTRRGNVILGFHFKRADSSRTILFSHGNSTDIGIMFYHLREMCSRLQCDVFAYEYSGYGESTGQPTELDLYADIEAAYHYLSNDCSLADEQIVCYGQSIGSVPSVELASRVTLGGLILHSAMKSGLSVIHNVKTTYWFDVFQNAARMKKVTSPTFVIHGTQDGEIPFEHGSALWDALPKELAYEPWWVMEAGHNDIEMNHRQEYFEQLQAFLKHLDRPEGKAWLKQSQYSEDAGSETGWQPLLGNGARRMGLGGRKWSWSRPKSGVGPPDHRHILTRSGDDLLSMLW